MFSLMSSRSKRSTSSPAARYDSVVVRLARAEDERAIQRLAALDASKVPTGRVLVAEADGEVIAAMSADGTRRAADPFRWTSEVMALMEMRAAQLAGADEAPATVTGRAVQRLRTQHA